MNVVYQLMNQAMYGGYGNNTYQNYGNYNNNYGNNNYGNYGNYRVVAQDNCSVSYTMEFEGAIENQNNGGYGGYGGNYGGSYLRINSFRFL
jgi:hypothetical protein